MNTDQIAQDTIVLIHGMWMTPLSWEHWRDRYTQRGLDWTVSHATARPSV